jgi:hypothetical protein
MIMKELLLKCFFFLLAVLYTNVLQAQDLWDEKTVATSFYAGTGTENDPYQIRTGAQLMYLENLVNAGDNFCGKYVKLMNDIEMNNNFSMSSFAGTIDGNGHFLSLVLGKSTNNSPFRSLNGRIHHLGFIIKTYNGYNGCCYGSISIVNTIMEGGVVEDCYYDIQGGARVFYYVPAWAYNNSGTIRNCYAGGFFSVYGASTADGSLLVYNNKETGVIENCYAFVNKGLTLVSPIRELPLAYTDQGTIIHNSIDVDELNSWVDENPGHSRWTSTDTYYLVDFNPGNYCNVEFIDELFNTSISSISIPKGNAVGQLTPPETDCTFIGWTRYGNIVTETDLVNEDWALFASWEQRIRQQPTPQNMRVEVDDIAHASFQWYAIYGQAKQLGEWKSANIGSDSQSSTTIEFEAKANQLLKFSYTVSSEPGCDVFRAYINSTCQLTASGENSGEFTYIVPGDGVYKLVLIYTKDDDTSFGTDNVIVKNIFLSYPIVDLACTQQQLPTNLIDQKGLFYCDISYSNTGVILSTDLITCIPETTNVASLTDAIYVTDAIGVRGDKGLLTINLKNAQTTNAYSFDLKLPKGIIIDSYELSNRHNGHTVAMDYQETTGIYSFAVSSVQSKDVKESDGAICTLTMNIPENIVANDYVVKILNAQYTLSTDATQMTMPEVVSLLKVKDYIKGDVNNDGEVDVADAVCIVNHVVGKDTPVYISAAADVNNDGDVDIADAVYIVNYIEGK